MRISDNLRKDNLRKSSPWKTVSLRAALALAGAASLLFAFGGYSRPVSAAEKTAPAASAPAVMLRDSYADVVDRVAPAVVTIRSAKRVRAAQQFPFLDDPFFRQYFGGRNQNNNREQESRLERALGSGVIVSSDGYIVTNHHVVDGAEQISVDLTDRRTFEAKVIGSDAPSDLAVLKIEAANLPVLPLGDSDRVRVGDVALAVGNPLGLGETVTAGIISARGRATGLSDGSFEDFLQTDAAINHGNSGGALVNTRGELIGINSQIVSPSGGNIGIGFAIPSNMALNVMGQLRKGGKVHRGKLGIGIQEITSDLAKGLGLNDVRGVLVNSVEAGGPAEQAGMKTGDVITAVAGSKVDDANALRNRIAGTAPGTDVALSILRDGKEQQLHAKLAELPVKGEAGQPATTPESKGGQLGVSVEPLTPETASQLGVRRGTEGLLVTEVVAGGPAAEAGVQADDVIVQVNRQPVKTVAELRAALRANTRPVLLLIHRGTQSLFLAVQPR